MNETNPDLTLDISSLKDCALTMLMLLDVE